MLANQQWVSDGLAHPDPGIVLGNLDPLWKLPRDTGSQFVVMHYFNISTGADSIHSVRLCCLPHGSASIY